MRKNYFLSLTTLVAVVALLFASCAKDFGDDIKRVDKKVDDVKTELSGDVKKTSADIQAMIKSEIAKVTENITNLKAQLEAKEAELKKADAALKATLEKEIKEIKENLEAHYVTQKSLTEYQEKVTKKFEAMQKLIDALQEADKATAKSIEELKTDFQKKIEEVKTELAEKATRAQLEELAEKVAKCATKEELKQVKDDLVKDFGEKLSRAEAEIKAITKNIEGLGNRLTGMVAIAEYNYNGLPALYVPTIATIEGEDCGVIQKKDGYVIEYHLNPSYISAADIDLDHAAFTGIKAKSLRSASSAEVANAYITAKNSDAKIDNGVLYMPVAVDHKALEKDGYAQGGSKFVKVALQMPLSEKVRKQFKIDENEKGETVVVAGNEFPANTVVTSDYVAIYGKTLKGGVDLKIAREKKDDQKDPIYLSLTERAAKALKVKGIQAAKETDPRVIELPYAKYADGINLVEYVRTMLINGNEAEEFNIAEYDLTYAFDLKDAENKDIEYILKDQKGNETDQQKFITIKDGIAKPKTYTQDNANAAQGRTPIVRVRLVKGDCVVMNSFIKIHFLPKEDLKPVEAEFDFTAKEPFVLDCDDAKKLKLQLTPQQMNEEIYNALGITAGSMSAKQFAINYPLPASIVADKTKGIGELSLNESEPMADGTRTEVLTWTFTQEEAWKELIASGKNTAEVSLTMTIKPADTKTHPTLTVTFKGKVTREGFDVLDLQANDLSEGAWVGGHPVMNVTVPANKTAPYQNSPEFKYDLNNYFRTVMGANDTRETVFGQKLEGNYYFRFYEPGTGISAEVTIGDKKYELTVEEEVSADGKLIASILRVNDQDFARLEGVNLSTFTLDETNEDAMELLNSKRVGGLFANIAIVADRCDKEERENIITIQGKKFFRIDFTRPISMTTKNKKTLTDDVNFGDAGSFVTVKDLVGLFDWRKDKNRSEYISFADDEGLWKYYDVKTIEVDLEKATTNYQNVTTAPDKFEPVNNTSIKLNLDESIDADRITEINYNPGRITYKNGGTKVKEYLIKIPAKVTYKFGVLEDVITIKVKSTTDVNGK